MRPTGVYLILYPNLLSNALSASRLDHPNDGLIVFVTANIMITRLLEGLFGLKKKPNYRMAQTIDEAIMQIDAAMMKEQST
jgi:hypothetical protein